MKNKPQLMVSVALTDRARTAVRIAVALVAIFCLSKLHAAAGGQPLTWLKTANYSALDRYLADLQRGYESGGVPERKLYEGFRALYEDGADNAQYFDRWVQAYPNSYAARTARGAYYYRMAGFVRGEKVISQTPPESIQGMLTYLARAQPDLLASLKMTAKPYLSTLYLLNVARLDGWPEHRRQWLDAGNEIEPDNVLLRLRYMDCLTPRWGGSLEIMRSFRAESERQHVSAALLTKFDIIIHSEAARSFAKKGDVAEAFNQWEQVLKLSATDGEPPSDESLIGYARSAWRSHRRADADRGLQQLAHREVDEAWVLSQMGWIYVQEQRMAEAWIVLQKAASLNDPWAQFSVGKTTYLGCVDINLPANRDAGLVWIRRSADQGFAEAKAFLLAHGG
jgi:tetratricopeptide (TPR) repeat protein